MSFIQYHNRPILRDPVVLVAFGGWNDAAEAATTAIKFLIDRWKPIKIAEIDSEDFFVFTETRPTVKFVDGIQRTIIWPTNQFFAHIAADFNRDIILFTGVEPQLKWKTFSSSFLEVCKHFNVSEVVFLGALLADVPHSIEVPISGTSSNSDVMERLREMDVHSFTLRRSNWHDRRPARYLPTRYRSLRLHYGPPHRIIWRQHQILRSPLPCSPTSIPTFPLAWI